MRYLLLLALLPCLWADEVKTNIFCSDGTECPFGKACCDTGCCDLPEEERLNKRLVPAVPPVSALNESMASPKNPQAATFYCQGTSCSYNRCCIGLYGGVCCPNPMYCCPGGTRCCSNSYSEQPWCCLTKQRCHSLRGYCLGGAASAGIAVVSLLFAFVLGVISKYFL